MGASPVKCLLLCPMYVSQSAQAAVTNHRLGGFHSSHSFLIGLGDEEARVKVPAGLLSGKGPLPFLLAEGLLLAFCLEGWVGSKLSGLL